MYLITVDSEKCQGCGECVSICPSEIYKMENDKAVVGPNAADCSGCQSCTSVCPSGAITITEN